MRILLLVDSYLPSTKAGAKLSYDLARDFRDLGHAVSVVAVDQNAAVDPAVQAEDQIDVLRVQAGAIKGAALWLRGWNEARLSATVWSRCRKFFESRKFDLVVFYSPTIFFGDLVARLKKLYGCPAYLILRDIFPQWAVDAGVLRKGLAYWFFKRKEYDQYRAADVIGVQSPANLDYFRERDLDQTHRLEVLYNWMRNEPARPSQGDHLERWGLKDKVVFFYGGNIGVAQDCDNLLRLASRLQRQAPQAHVLLVGEGSEVARLRGVVAEQKLENVSIKDALPQAEYLDVVGAADVGLISLDRNLRTQNFPGKLLSYMHVGIPILASINPGNDLKEVVEAAGAGFVSLNGNDDALFANACRLVDDRALREQMGLASRKLLEQRFSAVAAAEQILAAAAECRGQEKTTG